MPTNAAVFIILNCNNFDCVRQREVSCQEGRAVAREMKLDFVEA
jgi:hypothetical protein